MVKSKYWTKYKGKSVCLIVEDNPYPRKREGVFIDCDDTHIFLQTNVRKEPIPFLLSTIKRVDLLKKEIKENEYKTRRY